MDSKLAVVASGGNIGDLGAGTAVASGVSMQQSHDCRKRGEDDDAVTARRSSPGTPSQMPRMDRAEGSGRAVTLEVVRED